MTRAPNNLLAVRKLLLAHLDVDPTRARSIDLESAEVGIIGDAAHIGEGDSYHLGLPEQSVDGYSVRESSRDRALTEDACALDVGEFEVTVGSRSYDLRHFSAWCVGQCKAGAPDTRDIREVIWSPDGSTVRRWDRLGRRSTGDSSHRWHTHFSFHRDAIKAGRDLTPLFRRYLTTIGLIQGDDMPLTDADAIKVARAVVNQQVGGPTSETVGRLLALIPAAFADDDPAVIAAAIVDQLPADLAKQVAAELAARLAG